LSPGLDFESRIFFKPEAAGILRRELSAPKYRCRPIALGTNTDPYQPVEREHEITRSILRVLAECDHPVTIVTKSALVVRDIDILAPMAEKGLAKVAISVTTLDRKLARKLEPRAPTPSKRLGAIGELAAAGIPTAVMVAPLIPAMTDAELETIMNAAVEAGAREAGYILLRLPLEIKDVFREWLDEAAPGQAKRVMSLVRETRGGRDYDPTFHRRMRGVGAYADLIAQRFTLACRKLGLNRNSSVLKTDLFRPPDGPGEQGQLTLF
jgi:DNA repair photolyase